MKYKIYIPTLGRWERSLTADLLLSQNIDFKLVVEDKEYTKYADKFGSDRVLKLPSSNYGGVAFARNFIKEHSKNHGELRHWQIDDDIKKIYQQSGGKVINDSVDEVLTNCENFVDVFSNVGLASLSSNVFVKWQKNPFEINKCAYTIKLIDNSLDINWNGDVVEDIDYNLQVLDSGYCTLRFNSFCFAWSGAGEQNGGWSDVYRATGYKEHIIATQKKWGLGKVTKKVKNGIDLYVVDYNKKFREYKQTLKKL
jgi:hypothetical protein